MSGVFGEIRPIGYCMIGKNEKIIILIPVYNDWESLNKLILQISIKLETKRVSI